MIWLLALPLPLLSRLQVVSLSRSSCVSPVELSDGRGGRGAKSYDHEKAWSSINHSILRFKKIGNTNVTFTVLLFHSLCETTGDFD
jgi:hypothetical protein